MKISVFYQHVMEAAKQENKSIEEILHIVKNLGYEGLECEYEHFSKNPTEFKRMIDEAGLAVSGVYKFLDFGHIIDKDAIKKMVSDCGIVGTKKILAIPGFIDEHSDKDKELAGMIEGLKFLCDTAENAEIKVSLEDFDDTKAPFSTAKGLRMFMDNVPKLGYTYDTGNFIYSEEDLIPAFEVLKDRLVHMHLKDRAFSSLQDGDDVKFTTNGRGIYTCPTGHGDLAIKEAIKLAKAEGYDDFFTVEHFGTETQLDYMTKSINWIKENFNG